MSLPALAQRGGAAAEPTKQTEESLALALWPERTHSTIGSPSRAAPSRGSAVVAARWRKGALAWALLRPSERPTHS